MGEGTLHILDTGDVASVGKNIIFHDFGISNGIDLHDFGIRSCIKIHYFCVRNGSTKKK